MTSRKSSVPGGDIGTDPAHSRIDDQQFLQYLAKLADARRYVDEFFYNKYGFPAYPCLDILLIGACADDRVDIENIVENLAIAPSTALRHLELMKDCDLVTESENGYLLNQSAKKLLVDFVETKLSASFTVID